MPGFVQKNVFSKYPSMPQRKFVLGTRNDCPSGYAWLYGNFGLCVDGLGGSRGSWALEGGYA